ncbi:MAG TPA: hypothetical protein VIK39_20355 [Candidatus Angelobacter sp.]
MDGIVLLGWLSRDEAVKYLREDCIFDPQLTEEQAEAFWAEKKAAVDALPPRLEAAPERLRLSFAEKEAANKFLASIRRKNGGNLGSIQEVVKFDPRGLIARQFDITLDQSNKYRNPEAATWCARNCLATDRSNAVLNSAPMTNGWNFPLPHGEFLLGFNGQVFGIIQGAPHVSVTIVENRTILWAGYHRSYARAAIVNPEIRERSVLAALTTEGPPALAVNQTLRAVLLGERPPLFGDFFDDRLRMLVKLHPKRYELRIRVEVAKINAE